MVILRPSLARKLIGFVGMIVGIAGLVLPLIPGLLFIAASLWVLRDQYVWAARGVARIEARWPQAIPAIEAREQALLDWFARRAAPIRRVFWRG
jgi:uncharacterized membrane protein YbaN (DUF454 family)